MKKKILFYIQVPFLDINLEIVKLIKNEYNVHIIIELPSSQLKSNILNLDINLNDYNGLTSFWEVVDTWNLRFLHDFFEGCASVYFAVYKTEKNIYNLYNTSKVIIKYINFHNFDCFHFDDFSARQAFILPFINTRKHLIINVHDPTPHKGEFEWKRFFIKFVYYRFASYYVTFSNYSKNELETDLGVNKKILVFNLLPYTVFKKFQTEFDEVLEENRYITFFGRLSPYKGIDILLEAIDDVLKEFPKQKFFIGGRPTFGYTPNIPKIGKESQAILFIDRHLDNDEIVNIILRSKLVVCPYIEATQSGVVMTSYALNCPVLVTNVGGLPESVSDNVTGMICYETSKQGISKDILKFLKHSLFEKFRNNLKNKVFISDLEKDNLDVIQTIYS